MYITLTYKDADVEKGLITCEAEPLGETIVLPYDWKRKFEALPGYGRSFGMDILGKGTYGFDKHSYEILKNYVSYSDRKKKASSEIQSILFSKDEGWTVGEAKKWLKEHGYKYGDLDETENYFRFRQKDPEKGKRKRTIEFGKGIKAIVEFTGRKKKSSINKEDFTDFYGVPLDIGDKVCNRFSHKCGVIKNLYYRESVFSYLPPYPRAIVEYEDGAIDDVFCDELYLDVDEDYFSKIRRESLNIEPSSSFYRKATKEVVTTPHFYHKSIIKASASSYYKKGYWKEAKKDIEIYSNKLRKGFYEVSIVSPYPLDPIPPNLGLWHSEMSPDETEYIYTFRIPASSKREAEKKILEGLNI